MVKPTLLDRHQGEQIVDQSQLALGATSDHRQEALTLRAEVFKICHQLAVAEH
jgi:hypothetical protein